MRWALLPRKDFPTGVRFQADDDHGGVHLLRDPQDLVGELSGVRSLLDLQVDAGSLSPAREVLHRGLRCDVGAHRCSTAGGVQQDEGLVPALRCTEGRGVRPSAAAGVGSRRARAGSAGVSGTAP